MPRDLQASTNAIREHLAVKHGLKRLGVVVTDSTSRPMRVQTANVANGLAAAAVTVMGEWAEQTPIALLEDVPFVEFQNRNPTSDELTALRIRREDDMFWPFFKDSPWERGQAH